jgi:hypothetical protein
MKLSSLVFTLYPMGPPIVPSNTMLSDIVMYCVHLLRTPLFGLVVSLKLISLLTSYPIPNLLLSLGLILLRVNQLSLPMHCPNPVFLSLSAESLDLSIVPPSRSLLKKTNTYARLASL